MNKANRIATFFYLGKTVIRDNLWKEMAHMFADLFLIEMFQTDTNIRLVLLQILDERYKHKSMSIAS